MTQNIFVVRFYVNLKMNKIAISIAKDFSIHPGGRFKNEGPYSELVKKIKKYCEENNLIFE